MMEGTREIMMEGMDFMKAGGVKLTSDNVGLGYRIM